MTYAPQTLSDLAALWVANGGVNLGIVGSTSHVQGYHLGRDRIYTIPPGKGDADNSLRDPRDKAGLTNAAAGMDFGAGSQDLGALFSWLAAECMAHAPDCADIREVIGSPDGVNVFGVSYVNGFASLIPNYGDATHRTHLHQSWGRDAEGRPKTAWLVRYLGGGADMDYTVITNAGAEEWGGFATVGPNGANYFRLDGTKDSNLDPGTVKPTAGHVRRSDGVVGSLIGATLRFVTDSEAPWQPDPAPPVVDPDCSAAIDAEYTRVTQASSAAIVITFPPRS